ncbi:hypothetical protein GTGU_02641 [Trabulsiella guamensis ATCC 49490]|uniref:Uncharacterized protein n=1 Tax=Trabulsiella guamensis ATCC 49490 TaxID=1005994 RepID=A0A085A800_9ENTR|nr:hypothetical protein GTGU_02641 [Trabulsiella guamensis ATCC 49490]
MDAEGFLVRQFACFFYNNHFLIVHIWATICIFLAVLACGLALFRHRINKFNSVSDPIETFLRNEIVSLRHCSSSTPEITVDFESLSPYLNRRRRGEYREAVNQYLAGIHAEHKSVKDIPATIQAIEKLLTYARHR